MKRDHQILFLSHGGGPMPLLGEASHHEMVACLQDIAARIRKPSAILLISAHWEEKNATITAGEKPSLIYDYYGFPEESYHINYPCLGDPALAEQVHQLFGASGMVSQLDSDRGFDHGMFVPLKIMYPDADIPTVQLSLLHSLDPEVHLVMGEILHDLDYQNLLIIGSGFSFHNMREFFSPDTEEKIKKNEAFEAWLIDTCASPLLDNAARRKRLVDWDKAPAARFCHPREEHLLPLHVCYGAAQSACNAFYELTILNKKSSIYLWSSALANAR